MPEDVYLSRFAPTASCLDKVKFRENLFMNFFYAWY